MINILWDNFLMIFVCLQRNSVKTGSSKLDKGEWTMKIQESLMFKTTGIYIYIYIFRISHTLMCLILCSIEVESHVDDTWEQHLCSYMERCWTLSSRRSKPRRMASFLSSCWYIRTWVCFHYIFFFPRMFIFVQETFLLIYVIMLSVLVGSKRLFLLMLVTFLELKTMVLPRNGIPSSGKRSITSLGQAVFVIRRRLFPSPLQRLMLTSPDLQGKRTRLTSTDGLSRHRVLGEWRRMILRSHSHGLTVV